MFFGGRRGGGAGAAADEEGGNGGSGFDTSAVEERFGERGGEEDREAPTLALALAAATAAACGGCACIGISVAESRLCAECVARTAPAIAFIHAVASSLLSACKCHTVGVASSSKSSMII